MYLVLRTSGTPDRAPGAKHQVPLRILYNHPTDHGNQVVKLERFVQIVIPGSLDKFLRFQIRWNSCLFGVYYYQSLAKKSYYPYKEGNNYILRSLRLRKKEKYDIRIR